MVAAFHYGPMITLSVDLPPPVLDFNSHATQDWVKREAVEVCCETVYVKEIIGSFLCSTIPPLIAAGMMKCLQPSIVGISHNGVAAH